MKWSNEQWFKNEAMKKKNDFKMKQWKKNDFKNEAIKKEWFKKVI